VPLRERVRRASVLSAQDPYTLLVTLNTSVCNILAETCGRNLPRSV